MAEALRLDEQFAILTETDRSTAPLRVLKQGDTFACELLLSNRQPLLLSSTISEDNTVFAADLTNPDVVREDGQVAVARGLLHVFRSRVLWNGTCVERVRVSNHALQAIDTTISLRFDSDFADIFEVRGTRRRPIACCAIGVSTDPNGEPGSSRSGLQTAWSTGCLCSRSLSILMHAPILRWPLPAR